MLSKIATQGVRKGCEEVYAVIVLNLDSFDESERKDEQKIKDRISLEITRLSANLAEYKQIIICQKGECDMRIEGASFL